MSRSGKPRSATVVLPFRDRVSRHVSDAGPGLDDPPVKVIVRHALVGEGFEAIELLGNSGHGDDVQSDLLVVAGVVSLVELVPSAELGANGVPDQLEELDPGFGRAVRAPVVTLDE